MIPAVAAAVLLAASPLRAQSPPVPSPSPLASPSPIASPAPVLPAAKVTAVESAITAAMRKYGIPGLSVTVVTGRELAWSGAFGMADLENFVPAKITSVYRLASVTKPITATAILQLSERGLLELDAPVRKYLPSFPEKPWPVTVRQLLCHQSGIRNWTEDEFRNTRRYASVGETLPIFEDDPLVFEPGTKTLYSSFGYTVLGAVVEAVAGVSFFEYLRVNIVEPAGMESARVDDVLAIIPNRARGYQKGPGEELLNSVLSDTSNRLPAGGLVATGDDVARFASSLLRSALLRKETVEAAFARQKTKDGKTTGYGLGWVVGRHRDGGREVYHIGGQPRVSTVLYMRPDRGVAVVVLTNLESVGTPVLDLAREIAGLTLR